MADQPTNPLESVLPYQSSHTIAPTVHPPHWGKRIVGGGLFILIIALLLWLHSDSGKYIRQNPRELYTHFAPFISRHAILAPLIYVSLYITLATLALPVWWLQILAGLGFGLYEGTFLSLIGATFGSTLTVVIARWIAADWFHDQIERRLADLKKLDDNLGHNGLLVVMTVRLVHVLPFGAINYALGLTQVSYIDVMLGSFLGGIPAVAMYVGIGAHYHPLTNWRFDTALGVINLILLLPLILRYLRPQWFKKLGVE